MNRKLLGATLVLVVLLGCASFAQNTNVGVVNSATFSVNNLDKVNDLANAKIGLYNLVTFEHRNAKGDLLHKWTRHNLTTNAGKDFIKAQISGTGTATNCIYIAISTSAVTPAAGDTTLTGEVSTNGGARASGTYASTGTGTFTLSKVFTASGAISSIQSAAVFTASSSGTMCFEVGSLGPVTLASTDTLTVTWSGTIS
jgi:hypothetical protein